MIVIFELIIIWLIVATIIGQLIIFWIGYTILYFLPKSAKFPILQKFAISYGLGTGFLALSMFLSILVGINSRISYIPLLIIVSCLAIYFKIYKLFFNDFFKIFHLLKNQKFNKIDLFCIIFFVIELFFLFSYWFIYPVYWWDDVVFWDGVGKYIYYSGNLNYFEFLISPYPILIPLNMAFFFSLYSQYHYFAKIIFVSYFLFLTLFLYYSLRYFKLNKTYSLMCSITFALLGEVFIYSTNAYADLSLAYFYTIASIFLFYYISTEKDYYLIYSSIFMGFSAWTKQEGLYLSIVNIFLLVVYQIYLQLKKGKNLRDFFRKFFLITIFGFVIYLPWWIFSILHNIESHYLAYVFDLFDIVRSIKDLKIIFRYLLVEITNPLKWAFIFWFFFILILIVNYKSFKNEKNVFLLLMIIGHFLLKIVVYIITPFDLERQLYQSLDRELLHLAPLCCFLMGKLLSENSNFLIDFKGDKLSGRIVYVFLILFFIGLVIFYLFNEEIYQELRYFNIFKNLFKIKLLSK